MPFLIAAYELAYCLQAYQFGTNLTGIGMMNGFHVNEAFRALELYLG